MIKYLIAFTVIILITLNVTPPLTNTVANSVDRVESIDKIIDQGMGK